MGEIPGCTCGGPDVPGVKKKIIFSCSGASNVGELSNAAAVNLTKEGFGSKACTASLAIETPSVMKKTEDADEIVVIDGCPVGCARQIAENAGVKIDQYLIVTKLGIKKIGDMDIVEDDLETVVSAAWEGKCVCQDDEIPEEEIPGDAGCTCGGGCGSSADQKSAVLTVEWRHVGENVDLTCERCADTGNTLSEVLAEIEPLISEKGVKTEVIETVLPHDGIEESNIILFNGIPLEELIDGMTLTKTPCASCACITGKDDVECRAVEYGGELYEAIPADLIRKAALKAVEMSGQYRT